LQVTPWPDGMFHVLLQLVFVFGPTQEVIIVRIAPKNHRRADDPQLSLTTVMRPSFCGRISNYSRSWGIQKISRARLPFRWLKNVSRALRWVAFYLVFFRMLIWNLKYMDSGFSELVLSAFWIYN